MENNLRDILCLLLNQEVNFIYSVTEIQKQTRLESNWINKEEGYLCHCYWYNTMTHGAGWEWKFVSIADVRNYKLKLIYE